MQRTKPIVVTAKDMLKQFDRMAGDNDENLAHLPTEIAARLQGIKTDLIDVRAGKYSHLPFETLQTIAVVKAELIERYVEWKKQDRESGNPESLRIVKTAMILDYVRGFGEQALEITDPFLGTKKELEEQTAAWPPMHR